jgi:hypothetical protein
MQTLRDGYFTAYRSLKLTRDANGVLVIEFHKNGGRPEARRHDTRIYFIQPFRERIVREAALIKPKQTKSEAAGRKVKSSGML